MKSILFAVFLVGILLNQDKKIQKVEWIIGSWVNMDSGDPVYETWIKVNANELAQKSYSIKNQDTVLFERVRLVEENNTLFYIPTVADQNGGQAVRFALESLSDTQMMFGNPQHDFPQHILYRKISSDSLVAEISAVVNGQVRKKTFPMKRVSAHVRD